LLLDRKKIRRWAKWLLGIGYGTSAFNISDLFNGGCSTGKSTTGTTATNTQVQTWLDALKANPKDTDTMLKLAAYYEGLYDPTNGTGTDSANKAIDYLNQAIAADPTLKDAYLDAAKLYIDLGSYADAAKVLNKDTAVDPNNPDVYFYLGKAQKAAGNIGAAILAWQQYLQLAPDTKLAAVVRTQIQDMMTTTTIAPTTTTVAGGTTTTGASTTTTTSK